MMSVKSSFVVFLLVILVSFPGSETANITGLISKPPSPSYAVEGKNFTLEWTYTLDGTLSFALFAIANADGSDLNIGSSRSPGSVTIQGQFQARFRAHVTDTRAELTILAVQRSDEEKYKINIIATSADSVSEAILLVVNISSSITNMTGQNTVIERGNVTLKCLAEGKPKPTITWTRLSDNHAVTMPLINISRNHSGPYRCTANNGVGIPATRNISIDVQYPVEATDFGENATVPQGGKKTFSCPVDGNPKPNVSWYRSSELSQTPIFIGETLEAGVTGCYTCVASNSLGTSINITQCLTVEESFTASNTPTSTPKGPSRTVIGVVTGVAVFVVIMIGLVIWWVCKKNKCRKHTKNGEGRYVQVTK